MATIEVFHKSSQSLITINAMIGTAIDTVRCTHDSFVRQCAEQGVIVLERGTLNEQFAVNSTMVRLLVGTLGVEVIRESYYSAGWSLNETAADTWFESLVKKEFLGVPMENFAY
jgi:hypothetical protein